MQSHNQLHRFTGNLNTLLGEYETFHRRYLGIIEKKVDGHKHPIKPGDYESLYNKLIILTDKFVMLQKDIDDMKLNGYMKYLPADQRSFITELNNYVFNLSKSSNSLATIVEMEFLQSMDKLAITPMDFRDRWNTYQEQCIKCQTDGLKINQMHQKLYGMPILSI
jgi:hypothetical protein